MSEDEKKDGPGGDGAASQAASQVAARGEDEAPRWAADEPTAMWNADSVLEAGYDGVAEHLRQEDDKSGPAATEAAVKGDDRAKILTARDLVAPTAAPPKQPSSMSWVITAVVALGLGALVFFVVRMLR